MSAAVDNTDELYTGESTSMDYWRGKARDFQVVLNNLDVLESSLRDLRYEINGQDELLSEWSSMWDELQSKKSQFKLAAEAINLASNGLNAINVRFPQLSIPQSLGIAPAVGIAAALGGAAVLVYWASEFIPRAFQFFDYALSIGFADDTTRQRIIELKEQTNRAIQANGNSSLTQIATIVKYVLLGGALYLGYKLIEGNQNDKKYSY